MSPLLFLLIWAPGLLCALLAVVLFIAEWVRDELDARHDPLERLWRAS